MNGVTILNTIETKAGISPLFLLVPIFFIILTFLFGNIARVRDIYDESMFYCAGVGCAFGAVASLLILSSNHINWSNSPTVTQYEVTIDDTVSMKEFNKHYKIISQDGDIYTVEEIEE